MKKSSLRFIIFILILIIVSVGCVREETSNSNRNNGGDFDFLIDDFSGPRLKILAGSEQAILEPLIEEYARENKQNIGIDYLGSLDIMALLKTGEVPYDALWPASSIWLNMGDNHHMLKHNQTTSISPVVFAIEDSLAESLGFKNRDVYVEEIISAIDSGRLTFAMTSASQSNSGASAYLGFLTAIADSQDGLTSQDLERPEVQDKIIKLLSGVSRSSGSSNWLVDLYLQGGYDAMVNYEQLIIQANSQLESQGRESLYCIYPVDGLAISDSPLAYIDKGDGEMEEIFLNFQNYILSDPTQDKIEQTGKRSAFGEVRDSNKAIYKEEWGINIDDVVSPVRLPSGEVIMKALEMYQTSFKKPALTLYVLDYSGSMEGQGIEKMMEALSMVLIPENASENLLLGTSRDITYILPFGSNPMEAIRGDGNSDELRKLYDFAENQRLLGGTAMYEAVDSALHFIEQEHGAEIENYTPAIVLLSDGQANGSMTIDDLTTSYQALGKDIPIFSILFADASIDELEGLAELSKARVFDGRNNLVAAFKQVKGYN